MRSLFQISLLLAAAFVAPPLVVASTPAADAPVEDGRRISELIGRLADKSFRVREQATQDLMAIGASAKEALLGALVSPDAEVRGRIQRILTVVLEKDFKVRLQAFSADSDPSRDHGLAGWKRYQEVAGSDVRARELFVEMQRAEPVLMDAVEATPALASQILETRLRNVHESLYGPDQIDREDITAGRVAALVFLAAQPDVMLNEITASYLSNMNYQEGFDQAVRNGPTDGPVRKLLGAWISRNFGAGNPINLQNLMQAMQYGLKEGLVPAALVLRDDKFEPYAREYAILAVGKFGGKEHVPLLQPLLENKTVYPEDEGQPDQVKRQLRDVALAAMIHLTGQRPQDYGFGRIQPNPTWLFEPQSLGFAKAADREAAFAKWHAWAAAHPEQLK